MDTIRKAFLIVVGIVAVAYEEAEKSIKEATKTLEEQREKFIKPAPKMGA